VNVVITIDAVPVITAAQTKTICSGSAVNKEIFLTPLNLLQEHYSTGPILMAAAPRQQDQRGNGGGSTLHITDVLTIRAAHHSQLPM